MHLENKVAPLRWCAPARRSKPHHYLSLAWCYTPPMPPCGHRRLRERDHVSVGRASGPLGWCCEPTSLIHVQGVVREKKPHTDPRGRVRPDLPARDPLTVSSAQRCEGTRWGGNCRCVNPMLVRYRGSSRQRVVNHACSPECLRERVGPRRIHVLRICPD